jgi:hypothetical protein
MNTRHVRVLLDLAFAKDMRSDSKNSICMIQELLAVPLQEELAIRFCPAPSIAKKSGLLRPLAVGTCIMRSPTAILFSPKLYCSSL